MNIFEKYCVDDLMKNKPNLSISNAVLLLEYQPKTGIHIRQQFADYLNQIGLIALSNYLIRKYDYEDFFAAAKQEQMQRIKNYLYDTQQTKQASLEEQYREVKRKYSSLQRKHFDAEHAIKSRHSKELENLRLVQEKELRLLEGQRVKELDKIQKEIQEIEHLIKLENDPEYAAAHHAKQKCKQEEQERLEAERRFLSSFDIDKVITEDRKTLFPILHKLELKERLLEEEAAWLETKGKSYFQKDGKVYQAYHYLEAMHYLDSFKINKNLWHAVNASSHLRKANRAMQAETLLMGIAQNKFSGKDKKQKSALLTTFGGAKRDLGKFSEGIEMAQQAHDLSPKDYRPCTLLGALHFEIREYSTGSAWFDKAEKLGAPQQSADAEIKAIYRKADKDGKKKLKDYLLNLNPQRYAWLNNFDKKQ